MKELRSDAVIVNVPVHVKLMTQRLKKKPTKSAFPEETTDASLLVVVFSV